MMARWRRNTLIVAIALTGIAVALVVAYTCWRSTPPEGAPRIGLSMSSSFVVQRPLYEDAIARAGGRTVLITPTHDPNQIDLLLDGVDALVLTGGDDVSPSLYGGPIDDASTTNRHRDDFEIRLIRSASARDMPVLGICRGIQILNVAYGGSVRNLRDDEHLSERHGITTDSWSAHDVVVEPDTRLAAAVGEGVQRVNSFHGQAVGRVGEGLRVCASANDVIEGIEHTDHSFVIGIQWHPEIASLTDKTALALLEALVRQADQYRTARGLKPADRAAPAAD